MVSIQAPTHCPSCASELVFVNHILYCKDTSCTSQSQKKLEHFAKVLKIKGLGPSTISKLDITDFDEIYALSESQIAECLSSDKIAAKLYLEIQNSKAASLDLLLPAFGIPLIGSSATKKLSTTINHLYEVTRENCVAAGLGPKATDSLLDWLDQKYYAFYDGYLPFSFEFSRKTNSSTAKTTKGIVCITGKLKSFSSRDAACTYLENHGFIVKSTLTKDCTHLINESEIESTKTKNARSKGVIVTTIDELITNT